MEGRARVILDIAKANLEAGDILVTAFTDQYYLGYLSTGRKDGGWHSIRVEVRNGRYRIRARRGYFAS